MSMAPQVPPPGQPRHTRPEVPAHPRHEPAAPNLPAPVPAHLRPVPGSKRSRGIDAQTPRPVTQAEELAFSTIEVELGGRQKLVSTLSGAQLPADLERVLGAIADPDNDRRSLAKICADCGVALPQLLKTFQSALEARARLAASVKISQRLPDVAAAVMDAAVEEDRVCRKCLGARRVAKPTQDNPTADEECDLCKGVGTVRYIPDHDVQKTALKIGKLLDSGGLKVAVNQQTFAMGAVDSGSYDRLVGALDNVMFGKGRDRLTGPAGQAEDVVDAEVSGDSDG